MKGKLIIGSIVTILLLAMMFLGPREEISLKGFLMHCVMPALAVMLFWLNYLFLIPRYVIKKNKKKLLYLYNFIIIVCCCVFLTFWHDIEFQVKKNTHQQYFMMVRDSIDSINAFRPEPAMLKKDSSMAIAKADGDNKQRPEKRDATAKPQRKEMRQPAMHRNDSLRGKNGRPPKRDGDSIRRDDMGGPPMMADDMGEPPMHDDMGGPPMPDDMGGPPPMPDEMGEPPMRANMKAPEKPEGKNMPEKPDDMKPQQEVGEDSAFTEPPMPQQDRKPFRHPMIDDDNHFNILASLRDSVNFIFAIFVAFTIRNDEHITKLRQKQQEAETARREAEIRSLRNQISPHFLLNTLNNIYALAPISVERTQGVVLQLAKMLRHMLYDNQTELVTLKSEIDFISSYVDLMKLRLASNVSVNTEFVVDEAKNTKVAPFLFISLVENAFKHGVSSTEPCEINIKLGEKEGAVICDISNSNNPKQANDRSGHGVGLVQVQQRLDMTYSGRYTWTKGLEDDGLYHSVIILNM